MMNIKLIIIALVISFSLTSCGSNELNGDDLAKKRIIQKVEANGMGMIKDLEIKSVEKVNDSTYKGVHSLFNPMADKEVRVTRNYFFTNDLDSIIEKEDLKIEMKSEGEWVETGLSKFK